MSNPTTPPVDPLAKKLADLNAAHTETVNKINELSKHALRIEGAISICSQMQAEEQEAKKQAKELADLAEETLEDSVGGLVENDNNQPGE